ncbi:MAG: hypothetical protein ACXVCP_07925 [Bdellovibrio sp.]
MAKKAAKKEAPAAKAKKTLAKPAVEKKAAKAVKPVKPVEGKKAPLKKEAQVAVAAKAVKAEKPETAEVPAAKVAKGKTQLLEKAPVAKKVTEKKPIIASEKPSAAKKEEVSETAKAPKKEKKVKLDKSFSEDQAKWHELYDKYKSIKAPAYTITGQYEAKSPIQHKIFGWGFILSNEYDRLEVLFEDGKRMLISNRKLS